MMTVSERIERLREISRLKQRIADTDYKVIKSYEYALAGKDTPYNIDELHKEREALRAEINALQGEGDSE